MAWVGTPAQRPADAALLTMQAALNAAAAGQTVSFVPNDYVFTTRLTVPRQVLIDTASSSTLFAQFLVTGGGLASADDVTIGVNAIGAVITVNTAGAVLEDITITNPNAVARPVGVQLGAAAAGVAINELSMDGGGVASSIGINLTTASGAIRAPDITGVATGITTTSTASNISVTGGSVVVATAGIALGGATSPVISGVTVSGEGAGTGIELGTSSAATVTSAEVSGFVRGINAGATSTATGPTITDAVIKQVSLAGISLGTTQGATIVDPVITGTGVIGSTGINTVNAGRVTVTGATIRGYGYGIGAQSSIPAGSPPRADFVLRDIDVADGPAVSTGVYLLGTTNARVTHVDADVTGPGVVVHQSSGTRATDIQVTGHDGPTSSSGAAIFRGYDSSDLSITDSSISDGSYGFYFSSSDNVRITDAQVSNVSEFAIYGRSLTGLVASDAVLSDNAGAGAFSDHASLGGGPSTDITLRDITMDGNNLGVNLNRGTRDVTFTRNTVAGQRYAVSAAPAHDVTISDNTIRQADSEPGVAAIMVRPLYEDAAEPGSYSSSGIEVRDNVFLGSGRWIKVGTPDDTSDDANRQTLRDSVLVIGNTFPADSVAIRTYPNAVAGTDTATRTSAPSARAVAPVAVDARNHGNPNDWGSPCLATAYLDGELAYDGGGARVDELTVAPVLYPTRCIELSLTEQINVSLSAGDTVTWTLVPRNEGPRAAPAGWTVTQLLPDGARLVSMKGEGYEFTGTVATATERLRVGQRGPRITVSVRISDGVPAGAIMKDVAYIAPLPPEDAADLDGDGYVDVIVERPRPLVVPTLDTDTDESPTDNDAQGFWAISADGDVVPLPPSTDPPPDAKHDPDSGVWIPKTSAGQSTTGSLPDAGAPRDVPALLALGLGSIVVGGLLVVLASLRTRRCRVGVQDLS